MAESVCDFANRVALAFEEMSRQSKLEADVSKGLGDHAGRMRYLAEAIAYQRAMVFILDRSLDEPA